MSDSGTPHDQILDRDVEAALLSALLGRPGALGEIEPALHAEDFARRAHRFVYAALCEADERGRACGVLEIAALLQRDGRLAECGGIEALRALAADAHALPLDRCAEIVRERALQRRLVEAGETILRTARAPGIARAKLDQAQATLAALADRGAAAGPQPARALLPAAMDRVERLTRSRGGCTGLSTGLPALDRMTTGLQGGQVAVVAGRPSMGKTAFAMQIATQCAVEQGKPALVFSLEMSASDLLLRAAANLGNLDMQQVLGGTLDAHGMDRLVAATGRLSQAPLYYDDDASPSVLDMRARARRIHREQGLSLIVVDYLQLMETHGGRGDSRANELAAISRQIKRLAMDLDVPVLLLSQINRGVEMRDDKRPLMSDLRDSGAIEQDADLVLFLYRDEFYNAHTPHPGLAEIIIGKQRNGPTGVVHLGFRGPSCRFEPASAPPPMPTAARARPHRQGRGFGD